MDLPLLVVLQVPHILDVVVPHHRDSHALAVEGVPHIGMVGPHMLAEEVVPHMLAVEVVPHMVVGVGELHMVVVGVGVLRTLHR